MQNLVGITCYPVKSLRGHALDHAAVEPGGLAGDRRWMVVDAAGRFVTRREVPAMARIGVAAVADGLVLSHPDYGRVRVVRPDADATVVTAKVWRDTLPVRLAATEVNTFLSDALGRPVRLVHQHIPDSRPVDPRFGTAGDHVSLADGFPLLIATTASLAALNARLPVAVPMERFRPNLVIDGGVAWAEDGWRTLRIGALVLRIAKPCSRCIITTQHPLTGAREQGDEPLTTLRAMGRMRPGGIMFGENAIPETSGTIRVGDEVEVLDHAPA